MNTEEKIEQEPEPILRKILRQIFNITEQNQAFINDLLESNTKDNIPLMFKNIFSFKGTAQRRTKSILSDIFLRCLTSTQPNVIKSLIG